MSDHYYYWGMHLAWWFLWVGILIWIFVMPYDIPGQRSKKRSTLDIINKRYAQGQISTEEYLERKGNLAKRLHIK